MKQPLNPSKAAAIGAVFGVVALVIRSMFDPGPGTVAYFGGGALCGALIGFAYAKLRNSLAR